MTIKDPIIWGTVLDENPLPEGCPVAPADWPAWWTGATAAERAMLQDAAVPRLAEAWADTMQARLDAQPGLGVASVAAATFPLADVVLLRLTLGHLGDLVALLEAAWLHGNELGSWFHQFHPRLHASGFTAAVDG